MDYVRAVEEHMHVTPFRLQNNPGSGKVKGLPPCKRMSLELSRHHGPLDGPFHLGMMTVLVSNEVSEHSVKY